MNETDPQTKRQIKVPDLPQELYNDQLKHITYTTENVPSFLCTTKSIVTERYNSDPNLLRSTFYVLPVSEYSLECCALPLALVATPFSDRGVAAEVAGLERCSHCRSYFCCFTKHVEGTYVCNICGKKSTAAILHQDNLRYSTYEYTIPDSTPLLRPAFIFVFDFTLPWNAELADAVLDVCQDENFQFLYENVSFIILNHGISVFTKEGRSLSTVRILGNAIPFISSNIIFKSTDIESIRKVIETVKRERTNLKEQNTDGLFRIIKYISKFCSGAKIAFFSSVKHTELNYEEFLGEVKNVSINIFTQSSTSSAGLLPNTLHSLAFYSSGTVFTYSQHEIEKCKKDILFISTSRTTFDLSIVLKVSDSLVKTGIIAPSIDENLSVTHLNAMDPHGTATFLLSLSGLSKNIKYCQMQISFIDFDGSKKIRVLNHSFTTGAPTQFYSALAADTIFAVLCKIFISESMPLENPLVKSLIFYRSKCSTSTASTQFVLPESLKCLPVLIQAFTKNFFVQSFASPQAGSPGVSFKTSNYKARIVNMNVEQNLRFFYPRLFSLTDYTSLVQTAGIRLSMANILDTEVYIMENAFTVFLYVGRGVDPLLIEQLFDFGSEPVVRHGGSEEAALLNRAISEISAHYNRPMEIRVIRAGEPGEAEFLGYMVEDAITGSCDYVDFIFKMHFKVQKG